MMDFIWPPLRRAPLTSAFNLGSQSHGAGRIHRNIPPRGPVDDVAAGMGADDDVAVEASKMEEVDCGLEAVKSLGDDDDFGAADEASKLKKSLRRVTITFPHGGGLAVLGGVLAAKSLGRRVTRLTEDSQRISSVNPSQRE